MANELNEAIQKLLNFAANSELCNEIRILLWKVRLNHVPCLESLIPLQPVISLITNMTRWTTGRFCVEILDSQSKLAFPKDVPFICSYLISASINYEHQLLDEVFVICRIINVGVRVKS